LDRLFSRRAERYIVFALVRDPRCSGSPLDAGTAHAPQGRFRLGICVTHAESIPFARRLPGNSESNGVPDPLMHALQRQVLR